VLDVNGVGYLVAATPSVLRRATTGAEVTVETYLHVREDALQLYGFADAEERELFVHLLTVSGIGPKVALAVVSGSPAAELRKAIAMGDHARFQAIPGIGKKTAERIVLELKEKIGVVTEPALAAVGDGPSLRTILGFCQRLFGSLMSSVRWHVEVHQFRIEARPDVKGLPTPEGLHRDGVDYVLVLLVNRQNIGSGTTTIHGLDRRLLGSFTLTEPCDAALVDDARVFHGVTPVEPVDLDLPAYRDVLVVTFRRAAADASRAR